MNKSILLRVGGVFLTTSILLSGMLIPGYAASVVPGETANLALAADQYQAEKTALLTFINDYRAENGRKPLTVNPDIAAVAQNWSTTTADAGGFKHNPDFWKQIPPGWTTCGENIAANDDPESIFFSWVNSEGHRLAMLNADFKEIGIGYAYQGNLQGEYPGTYYATANFAAYPVTVTAAPPIFAAAAYTIPDVEGVQYRVNGSVRAAGTYPGTGTVTVTAGPKPGYIMAPGAPAEWTATFRTSPLTVTPATVVFTDKDGTAEDTFTVPATAGVEYLLGGKVVVAGTLPGLGTVTVTARATTDYVLAAGTAAEWTFTFQGGLSAPAPTISGSRTVGSTLTAVPGSWTPAPDSLSYQWYRSGAEIPGATSAAYKLAIADVGAALTVRVTGVKAGYGTVTADSAPIAVEPAPSFRDINGGSAFATEISWLATAGVTQGWTESDGSRTFRSAQPVNRDQMAAFLYRLAGSPDFVPPALSPFADVPTTHNFYKEISWLWTAKISEGWKEADGSWTFRPAATVNRDQMAAFIYRHFIYRHPGSPDYVPEATSPFADISTNHNFYKQISWLAKQGITNGWTESDGSKTFRAGSSILRDQMAAFMYRYANLP